MSMREEGGRAREDRADGQWYTVVVWPVASVVGWLWCGSLRGVVPVVCGEVCAVCGELQVTNHLTKLWVYVNNGPTGAAFCGCESDFLLVRPTHSAA
jgi:hypothetical protein